MLIANIFKNCHFLSARDTINQEREREREGATERRRRRRPTEWN